ncbi:MAG: serine/threonine-protein kinase [Minicystis sp.]
MDDLELAKTIERRIEADPDLARTLVKTPRATIVPGRVVVTAGNAALASLRALGGSVEGRIALQRTIGEGGMGVVHLATQATVGREVAVKTLRAGAGDLDATLRILREAWVTGALEHPNVVPIYDVGVDAEGSPVIVMKRIEGRDWAALMHAPEEIARLFSVEDPLEWNLRILASVCNAVHFAHSRGILHRDLKPDNVMIGSFGEVYLVDWGIAVSLHDDPSGRLPLASEATGLAGTPAYFAPEMLLGDPGALSPRTDVYLLGAILYEIFAGEPPHQGESLEALISSALLSTPRFPESFPSEAAGICRRALARDPLARPESAEALRIAVLEYIQHRGSRRLAFQAKQSHARLVELLESEPPGEDKTLAVFNLLGECRFGYRAALSAWKDNEVAQSGLDRALLAVVEHELADGDAHAAAALLREVNAPPAEIVAKVEAAVQARAEHDERLRRLEKDLDPRVGTRTRTFIGAIFGAVWTLLPITQWIHAQRGGETTYPAIIGASLLLFLLGGALFLWARQTLTETLLNRRLSSTLGLHLVAQMILGAGAWLAGLTVVQSQTLLIFTWGMTQILLAIWVERWFALAAAVCAISFLLAARFRAALHPLMALDNLVFTTVLLRVWFPKGDIARIHERRRELRRKALRWLRDDRGARSRFDEDRG